MTNRVGKLLRFRLKPEQDAAATDAVLVEAIQQGDEQAWARFVERHTDLIYAKAWDYSQTAYTERHAEQRDDEAMELYAFMVQYVRRSLRSFKGYCQPRTWVNAIVKNRSRIVKAYLLDKNPERAEVRLPKVIEARSADDQEIFKRLVWGMDPGYIAQDLNLPEDQCWEIETLLKNHAKRVYERVMANRTARQPKLSIDALLDDDQGEDRPLLTPIDAAPDPEQMLVLKEEGQDEQTRSMVFDGILDEAAKVLSTVECLILIFLYNEEYTAAQIVQAAASNEKLGLAEVVDVNRVYYIKDRALGKVLELVVARLNRLSETGRVPPKGRQRALLKPLEEFIKEQGFPVRQA